MKTKLLLILFAASLAGSCKKSDKHSEAPKEDFIQLQQMEHENGTIRFQYNEQNQLTKIEQLERIGDGSVFQPYQYTNFTWTNGIVTKAELFDKSGNLFYKRTNCKYEVDAQKRIAYIARTFYHENGTVDRKDTVDFTFNAKDQLVGVEFSGENYHAYSYDARGNFMPEDLQELNDNEVYTYAYDFRYDNNPNPFASKGLGLHVFSVYFDEPFLVNQLLSRNNPVYAKTTLGHTILGEHNIPLYSNENSYTSEFSNSFDTNGGLKEAGLKYAYQRKENGNVVDGYTEHTLLRFTCLKKQ
ncbi:hypothetical protein [Pseudobacter ginsenosidimutans]|uniref:YD repeat-containing protein n=1 Tax=Pseudobacter ginsenosidimutans TaxID=661488 RepID=A0A4Q7N5W9_9BACT|nr:hypothetical protein [Pseudobacter ginsenosidimutans]QEC44962.1 hypothetical protein FSB84_25980 [Pseudobacter ginsenosidimutans]RZS76456.1 hypothetical protein EV199_2341 [Pseudobacter ginsenosidimutans]